jgi:hypothetical protein
MSAAALESLHVEARDVFGKPVGNTFVDVEEKRTAGGSHYLATVSSPGYLADSVVLDFNGHGELVLLHDAKACKCPSPIKAETMLLEVAMRRSFVAGASIHHYRTSNAANGIVEARADRAFYYVGAGLEAALEHSRAWVSAPAKMHDGPEGIDATLVSSHKGLEPHGALQLVLWRTGAGALILEADIDLDKGVRHAFDALIVHKLTGQPDPRNVAELLVLFRGFPLPWEFEPLEELAP